MIRFPFCGQNKTEKMNPVLLSIQSSKTNRSILLGVLILLSVGQVAAQAIVEPSAEALATLDRRIRGHMEEFNIPGAVVAVASRGQVLHLETYGLANVELSVPVTDSTVFEIGSISKQFVAAVTLMNVEEERLGLDDPIHVFLSELPSEWLGVTVRQLLSHTSGIPDYEEIRSYDVYRFRLVPEDVIRSAHSRPMDFAPGEGYNYSNTGYYLLSMIIERIEGKPLGEVLKNRIFDPLAMTQTRMADPEVIIPHRASGYWVNRVGKLINRNPTETSSTLGAGGLLTSAFDLIKWDEALYGDQLLSADSKAVMWTAMILPNGESTEYGLGWQLRPYRSLMPQSHGGQVAGFNASFARLPEHEICFVVFYNRYRVSASYVKIAAFHAFLSGIGEFPFDG